MAAHPSRRRTGTLWLVAVLALAGCQLRLETPPPPEPSPDAQEQVRERAVDQALALRDAAGSAGQGADATVSAVLGDVTAFSAEHADALGGVYDSGLPTPTATATPAPPPAATPDEVLADLREAATAALGDAGEVADGGLARLLAQVGAARTDLAARLAAALGVPVEEGLDATPASTAPPATPPPATPETPETPATPTPPAVSDPTATATAADESTAPTAPEDGTPAITGGLPDGMTDAAATAVVLAHDQAGYAYEVLAAKSADDERAAALAAAATHRAAASDWARRAGIEGAADPRRAAYALPDDLDDPAGRAALAARLESAVAESVSAAIPATTAGSRGELVALLVASSAAARAHGAAPGAFPGSSDAAPEPTTPATGGASEGPPRWPPLDGTGPLPTHLPQDSGSRPGATGTATAEPDGSFTYVVASGDVLGAIGLRFFPEDSTTASVALLQAVNTIAGEAIRDGDPITVPNGRYTATG